MAKQVWTLEGVDYMVAESREEAIRLWEEVYGPLDDQQKFSADEFSPVEDDSQPMTIDYIEGDEPCSETHSFAEWARISDPCFLCSTEY